MTAGQEAREPGRASLPEPNLPGISPEWRRDLDQRIVEFGTRHQDDVVHGGRGWVPRVRHADYMIAVAANVVIVIWMILVLVGGD
jgi:hypothetical protein